MAERSSSKNDEQTLDHRLESSRRLDGSKRWREDRVTRGAANSDGGTPARRKTLVALSATSDGGYAFRRMTGHCWCLEKQLKLAREAGAISFRAKMDGNEMERGQKLENGKMADCFSNVLQRTFANFFLFSRDIV